MFVALVDRIKKEYCVGCDLVYKATNKFFFKSIFWKLSASVLLTKKNEIVVFCPKSSDFTVASNVNNAAVNNDCKF